MRTRVLDRATPDQDKLIRWKSERIPLPTEKLRSGRALGEQTMNEGTGITVLGIAWIVLGVLVAFLVLRYLFAQQNPPIQPAQSQKPIEPL